MEVSNAVNISRKQTRKQTETRWEIYSVRAEIKNHLLD